MTGILTTLLAHAGETSWFPTELPPLHPLLVNFTAALVPVSVVADVLGRWLRKPTLEATGWWTIATAAAVTPFTALAGWMWLRQMPEMDMPPMPLHRWLGTALAVTLIPVAIWRGRSHAGARPVSVSYLVVATSVVLAVIVQGHVGANMTFGDGPSPGDGDAMSEGHDARAGVATREAGGHLGHADQPASAPAAAAYTCEHHLEILPNQLGECPKCGMKLVPKK